MTSRSRTVLLFAAFAALSGALSGTGHAACVPHVESRGPSVTISPDYQDPTRTDYSYDSEGTFITVITCLEG